MCSIEYFDQELNSKFNALSTLADAFLQEVYGQQGFSSLEMAIFLHLLSEKEVKRALSDYAMITPEHFEQLQKNLLTSNKDFQKLSTLDKIVLSSSVREEGLATLQKVVNKELL